MMTKFITLASVSALALTASASLASAATASAATDLNLRAGPGEQYQIMGVIQGGTNVEVNGCLASAEWCEVSGSAGQGWAYAPYLLIDQEGTPKPLAQVAPQTVTVIEDTTARDEATMIGAGMGALAGALVAGPVGAVAGAMMSGIAANNAVDTEVTVYVQENPVEPVFLRGEPVVGASVPAEIVLFDVPTNQQVAYLNVNGNTVLVERDTRRIIQVVR